MPVLKDEKVFLADGIVFVDPSIDLRRQAEIFVKSRQWTTSSIFYGDQPETAEDSEEDSEPRWSMTFALGLDHVPKTTADWFSDVAAIIEFLQPIARKFSCEFTLEFRLSSRLWYSETLGFVGDCVDEKAELAAVRSMLELCTRRRNWWQKLWDFCKPRRFCA